MPARQQPPDRHLHGVGSASKPNGNKEKQVAISDVIEEERRPRQRDRVR